jgi:hypothetical protein
VCVCFEVERGFFLLWVKNFTCPFNKINGGLKSSISLTNN